MIALRKLVLFLHILHGMLVCATIFPFIGKEARRRRIRAWSLKMLAICGVEFELDDRRASKTLPPGAMLVSNHISWLDIYVIHCWEPTRFVAKSEIRGWPVIGWLCDKTGTIFIERANKRDAHRVLHQIAGEMKKGDLVGVFPEGTTTDGSKVLPFHANLLQAPVSEGIPVQPVGLSYIDAATGETAIAPAYIDDITLLQCLDSILRAPKIKARLTIGEELRSEGLGRRELAETARAMVLDLCGGAATPAAVPDVAPGLGATS
ncbi:MULTISPECIES: lysophospholipid acyltransferase family protein [unclassified Cupriavidus]|uniref:lysophospholipid acyltransferase family protein n=1 Tax=Cupriavidus sp. H19C3 TaxID=3241603 RepID=UPI003BF7AEF0